MAVPSVFVRSTAQKMKPFCKEGQLIVDVAKGIEENTLDTMTQIIKEELPMAETAVLSGPSHAEEVSRGLPTLCVAGSRKKNSPPSSVRYSVYTRVRMSWGSRQEQR